MTAQILRSLASTCLPLSAVLMVTGCASWRTYNTITSNKFVSGVPVNVQTVYVHAFRTEPQSWIVADPNRIAPDQTITDIVESGLPGVKVVPLYRDDMTEYRKQANGSGSMAVYNTRFIPTNVLHRLGPNDAVMCLSVELVPPNNGLFFANAVVCGVTFTLVPMVVSHTVNIGAVAYNKQGAKIWSGYYSDSVRRAVGFCLLPWTFSSDTRFVDEPKRYVEIYRDFVTKAVVDLTQSKASVPVRRAGGQPTP